MTNKETRSFQTVFELRKEESAQGPGFIEGYAAVFNSEAEIGGMFREQIAPDAFSEVLADDVRALFNHNVDQILGRTKSGTLTLSQDSRGLYYRVELPDTELGRSLAELVRRGDISQSSFGFVVKDETYSDLDKSLPLRTITKFERLLDVSPVTFPAFVDTTVAKRSLEEKKISQFDTEQALRLRCELLRKTL